MSTKPISHDNPPREFAEVNATDWAAFDSMTDADIAAAVAADPDAAALDQPLTAKARRVGLAGAIRFRVGLTPLEFEARYRIPVDTLRAWERGDAKPDAAMLAYLVLIDADPAGVAATLANHTPLLAAE